ncbi:MAG: hypothetical protein JEZ09_08635 [Salinivirgaceae bacterium]|nr:hypothetical protein [Salinivirgaceae bacterium]
MSSKFIFHSKFGLGLYKFKGDITLNELLNLLVESYSNPEFKDLSYTILDFRECTFSFEASALKQIVQLVEKHKDVTQNVRATLLVSDFKVMALSTLFQHELGIQKQIVINSTVLQTINFFDLQITVNELEGLLNNLN